MASGRFVVISISKIMFLPEPSMHSTATPARVRSSASWRGSTFRSTNSRNQLGLILICALCELLQKSQISLEEELNVVDSVAQHGDSFHSHTKGEAADLLGIVIHKSVNRGINHAASQQLNPSTLFAKPAGTAV